jgi:gas vesicle structural protein
MARRIGRSDEHTAVERAGLGADDGEQLVLSDLINRVLDKGVVISGHVTISVADIDLIAVDLRLLVTSIQTALSRATNVDEPPTP